MEEAKPKNEYIMLVNVISMLAVVFMHVNNCFWTFSTEGYWKSADVIESVMYFAVPCFFMISGANLMDYRQRYNTKTFLIKRTKKTIIPYVFWSMFGILFGIWMKTIQRTEINLKYIINGLVNSSIVSIYWFFIPLYAVYLVIPFFAAVDREKRKSVFMYISIIGFLLNVLIPFLAGFTDWIPNNPSLRIYVSIGYLLYFVVGWLIHTQDIKKIYRIVIYVCAILGLLVHMFGTYYLSIRDGGINSTYKGYNNVPCIFYSIGIFLFFKQVAPLIMKNIVINKIVVYLNQYTFGIYLIHWFVLTTIVRLTQVNTISLVWRLLAPFGVVAISVCIIWVIRKIPILKHVIP